MLRLLLFCITLLACATGLNARERELFDYDWLFSLNPKDTALYKVDVEDSQWRTLSLPHDWAIEGDFSASNPSGAGGGALPGGIGWYRKHFKTDLKSGERLFVDFDGVYMNSTVWINGHKLGTRPYGYSSFSYDLTPYLHQGNASSQDNVLAVKVDNSDQPNSRWYSGCGIYRHVWLTKVGGLHIGHWGTHVVTDGKGNVTVSVELENVGSARPVIRNIVYDMSGKEVARHTSRFKPRTSNHKHHTSHITLHTPRLWSPSSPYIYNVKTQVIVADKVVDEVTTTTGFRNFRFDAKTGFWLNGKNMKINGVCMHHDMGCIGSAFSEDALHRQLLKLKEMGCNAIRCSHNPPSPELLNMCDTMGFIVMDEAFDMWRLKKTENDYARFFDEWHERDLTDLVRRDRNHPSIMMWSIGNEVQEQWRTATPPQPSPSGRVSGSKKMSADEANIILNKGQKIQDVESADTTWKGSSEALTRHLADIVRRNLSLDGNHKSQTSNLKSQIFITAGCNEPSPSNHLFKSGALDIIGFNYHRQWVKDVPKNFPGKPFLFSESVSALQTRGYYRMPSDSIYMAPVRWDIPYTNPSMMCSAYDNSHASWSSTHEETWDIVKHNPFVAGQFIWTGWDYIGEPTPYGFPERSSNFGIIDLAGFPKDVYYMYQSEWTNKPVLHLFPHWNWVEGQTIDMWCYYNNADEVELFVNGKSQGVRRKSGHQYHVWWRVKYAPGEVKVVARKDGKVVRQQSIKTAGSGYTVRLTADYDGSKRMKNSSLNLLSSNHKAQSSKLKAQSLIFVSVEVVDKDGNLCPWASDDIHFDVKGGTVVGVDNGCAFSMERFKADHRKAFFGKCMVAIRKEAPTITVTAKSPMLKTASETF